MNYQLEPLPNGALLATAPMPHMTSVSVGLWVGVGGRYEPLDLCGASHFIEHLLFKGTRRRTAREISEAVEGVGGSLNAFTSEEHTCYYAKVPHAHLAEALEVLGDMLSQPRFARSDVEKERRVIGDELAMYEDQPQQYVQELLNKAMWPRHPLGRPLTGTCRSVKGLRRADLTAFYRTHYVGPALVIAVAGHFSPPLVHRLATRLAKALPGGARDTFLPARWTPRPPVVRQAARPTEQTHLALGIRTWSRLDDRRYALRLLNAALGENMSSLLFQAVREEAGLVYSIDSTLSFFADTGDLVISAGLDGENLGRVLRLVVRELRRLACRPLTRTELARVRDYVLGQIDLSTENTESQMLALGEQVLAYGHTTTPETYQRRLRRVSAETIQRVAGECLRPERLTLALVSPVRQEREAAAALARL